MPITAWLLSLSTFLLNWMVGCLKQKAIRTITGSIFNANVCFFLVFFFFQGPLSEILCNFLWCLVNRINRNLFKVTFMFEHVILLCCTREERFSELATNHLILASIFFSGSPFRYIIKERLAPNVVYSQVQIVCFGRTGAFVWQIFLPSIHKKKKKLQGLLATAEKTFHSIFTYCRCSPSLLNDGGSDLLVTCGLILHLLYCSVSC